MRVSRRFFTSVISVLSFFVLSFLGVAVNANSALAQAADPHAVSYTLQFFNLEQHLLHVHTEVPPGAAEHDLQLPVWNATYQVRDFAQYVNWVRAQSADGRAIQVHELDKSRWHIAGTQNGASVDYEIYVDSFGPFGAQVNPHHVFLNLAQVLMYPVDDRGRKMIVSFQAPDGWKVASVLSASKPGNAGNIEAENYDRLVDSPLELGNFQESDFDEAGGHFRVVVDADPSDFDMQEIVLELHKITAAAISWMNDRPFDNYMFLYHFPRGPGGGGMEHAYCTAIDLNASLIKQNPAAVAVVTAHEFFHLWNVKRIRPKTLEPVDYTKENYTRALWFSEGVTSTVENVIQLRAGLMDEKQFLTHLGEAITELERRPAHLTQSAEESSLDAWLEGNTYYRRPERSISYYNKGELLGVVLDLAVRDATHDHASLREVMQWMNQNYAKKGRFFADSDGVREAAEAVSHADLASFFAQYVAGTDEIPWDEFFRGVGLKLTQETNAVPDAGFVASRNFDGPMLVGAVTPGGDAERAGLLVGDTILEIQGKAVGQESRDELARLSPGDTLAVKVRPRRGAERELKWKIGSRQEISYRIKDLENVTAEQRVRRAAWLKGEAESEPPSTEPHPPQSHKSESHK